MSEARDRFGLHLAANRRPAVELRANQKAPSEARDRFGLHLPTTATVRSNCERAI